MRAAMTACVRRSGVSVHSAAVPVHVHEEAMQLEHEGLDENEDEYEDVYVYGEGNDETSGQPGDAGDSQ